MEAALLKFFSNGNIYQSYKSISKPSTTDTCTLSPNEFADAFQHKVKLIRTNFNALSVPHDTPTTTNAELSHFTTISYDNLTSLVSQMKLTHCDSDIIPIQLFAQSETVMNHIVSIINASITSSTVPTHFKSANVRPLLKKPNADTSRVSGKSRS